MSGELIAWFEKDGIRRGAYSPSDAVDLQAHGFTKVADVDPDTMIETPVQSPLDELTALSQELGHYDLDNAAGNDVYVPMPPPLVGIGSGIDEWRAYAAELGVPVEDLEKRGDIVDAIRDAGHPVEKPVTDQQ